MAVNSQVYPLNRFLSYERGNNETFATSLELTNLTAFGLLFSTEFNTGNNFKHERVFFKQI